VRVTPIEFDAASGVRTGETQPIDLPPTIQCSHRPSLSADQKRLAFVSGDGNVYVLNVDEDTKLLMIQDNDDDLAALSADGRWLATYAHGRHGVNIWSADQGQRLASLLQSHTVAAAAFSPDGGYLVVDAGDSMISLEPGSWNELGRVELRDAVMARPVGKATSHSPPMASC